MNSRWSTKVEAHDGALAIIIPVEMLERLNLQDGEYLLWELLSQRDIKITRIAAESPETKK